MDKQRDKKTYLQKKSTLQMEEKVGEYCRQREIPINKAGNAETTEEIQLQVCLGHCYSPGGQYFKAQKSYETILELHLTQKSCYKTIPPLKSDGVLHPDPVDKVEILNKQFKMAFLSKSEITREVFKSNCNMRGNFETMPQIIITITEQGIQNCLKMSILTRHPYQITSLQDFLNKW